MEANILKSTTVDTRNLSAKSLDSDKIILEGQGVLEIIENGTPQIKDFVNRMDIGEDEYYVIWDDTGQPVYNGLKNKSQLPTNYTAIKYVNEELYSLEPNVTSLNYKFQYCTNLKEVRSDLSNISSLNLSFIGCHSLETFEHPEMTKITNLHQAFNDCKNLESFIVGNLLNCEDAKGAFRNAGIKNFNYDMPCVTAVSSMFENSKLESFNGNLDSLTNGYCMFLDSNLKSFKSSLKNLKSGRDMFAGTQLTTFNTNLPAVDDIRAMFRSCHELESVTIDECSATNIHRICDDCIALKAFKAETPLATDCTYSFRNCKSLETLEIDLSSATDITDFCRECNNLYNINLKNLNNVEQAGAAFYNNSKLTAFNYDMPKLSYALIMFSGCSSLVSFSGSLDSLESGNAMFERCFKLENFNSKLPKLAAGSAMFVHCILNKDSVIRIINTIKNDNICENSSKAQLAIGINANLKTDEELLSFLGISSAVNQNITITNAKGLNWRVTIMWNTPPAT